MNFNRLLAVDRQFDRRTLRQHNGHLGRQIRDHFDRVDDWLGVGLALLVPHFDSIVDRLCGAAVIGDCMQDGFHLQRFSVIGNLHRDPRCGGLLVTANGLDVELQFRFDNGTAGNGGELHHRAVDHGDRGTAGGSCSMACVIRWTDLDLAYRDNG